MKKKLIIIGGVLALLLGALVVAPNLIDWNSFKPQVASAVEAASGKKVRFDGDLSFKLWPSPALRASDVSLPNIEGGAAENFIEMEGLDIRLEFFPLLSGNVKVTSLVVDGGKFYLERDRDGLANWEALFVAEEAPAEPAQEKEVAINSFLLSDTDIYYANAQSGLSDSVTAINADLVITSLAGPFTGSGDLVYRGFPFDFTFATGLFAEGSNIPLRLSVVPNGDDPGLNFQGTFVQEKGVAALSGNLKGKGGDLSPLVGLLTNVMALEETPKGPWDNAYGLDSNLLLVITLGKTDLVLDPLDLSLGETLAKGAFQMLMTDTMEARTRLSINTFNANDWLADKEGPDEPFELPGDIKADIALEVGTFSYNEGVVQKVDFKGRLEDGKLLIENLAAVLPGNSDLRVIGDISSRGGKAFMEAMVHLDARAFRDLAGWLDVDLSAYPENRVTRLTFDGRVRFTDPALEIMNSTVNLDSTGFAGGITLDLDNPSLFAVAGSITSLDLDTYYPELLQDTGPKTLGEQIEALQEGLGAMTGYKGIIDLKAERLKMMGANIRDITFKGALNGNAIEVTTLSAGSFEGAAVSMVGKVGDIPGRLDYDLTTNLSADTFKALMAWAETESPFDERVIPQGAIKARLTGDKNRARYNLSGTLSGIEFSLAGSAENLMGTPVVAADLSLAHERTIEFIRKFSPDYFPAKNPLGRFSLKTALKGDEGDFRFENLVVQMGPARFGGELRHQDLGGRPAFTGRISAGQLRLDDFMAPAEAGIVEVAGGGQRWSGDVWDTSFLKDNDFDIAFSADAVSFRTYNFASPSVRLRASGGVLTIQDFRAGFYGGTLSAGGSMDATAIPVLNFTMALENVSTRDLLVSSADINRLTGRLNFTGNFQSRGQSQTEVIGSLAGQVSLSSNNGVIRGINMQRLSQRVGALNSVQALGGLVSTTFEGGETPYRFLRTEAAVKGGVIRFDRIESDVDATEVGGRGSINLPAWTLDISGAMRLKDYPNAPAIGFNMKGPVGVAQAKFDYAAFTAHLTQQLTNNLFQNLLGAKEQPAGGGATPPPGPGGATPPAEEAEPTPEEQMLKGLFELLGGDEEDEEDETDDEGGGG